MALLAWFRHSDDSHLQVLTGVRKPPVIEKNDASGTTATIANLAASDTESRIGTVSATARIATV
ncbi:hypothetical protein [Stieleria varia]|uniref:hypothetical protein n=1 Tax=Stieleria varia TaxID=2528005 RepID=UPI0011B3800D|nr:hypothetical protein [Stieleria varia]